MAKPPAFQFYARDWLAEDGRALSLEEKGAHVDLLCFAWLEEGIPADPDRLARILGLGKREFGRLWPALQVRWEATGDGRLINRKMEDYRAELAAFRAERSQAGKNGAEKRWAAERARRDAAGDS